MSARHSRDSAVSTSVGTCRSCGTNLLLGDLFCGGCGTPVPQEAEGALLAGLQQVTLGEHEILGILGRGGMGLVYLAHDISLNRKVAIKVLPPSMLQGDAAVERFRREARIAASLRHRCITSVFGLKETTKVVFFVMEYVEGRTLDAVLHDEGRLTIDAIGAILHDTAGALSYAHRREVVHRDLKPANVIIDVDGMAMITDFGVAKVTTSQGLTTTGSTVGSPKYMSPEQWSGKSSGMSDQYALGCVAYELLAGRAPFVGETIEEMLKQHLFDAPQPVGELRPDCPPALASAVMRMLEKDPGRRWPSLDAVLAEIGMRAIPADDPVRLTLATFGKRGHDVRALPPTPKSPIRIDKASVQRAPGVKRPPGLKRPLVVASAAGALVLIAALAYFYIASRQTQGSVATTETPGTPRANVPAESAAVKNGAPPSEASAPMELVKLNVEPREVRIAPGTTVLLKVTATGKRGDVVAAPRVRWKSYSPSVAAVSRAGMVTGLTVGTARIGVSGKGAKRGLAVVTVAGTPGEGGTKASATSPGSTGTTPAPSTPGVVELIVLYAESSRTETPWAFVSIDGRPSHLRTRGIDDTLSAGVKHRVRLHREGLHTVDTTVTLQPGERRVLKVMMTRIVR